jgi:CobQ-like glutamine amidotransferase family enzyme
VTGASTIRIGLLLPDVLGTYSDTGNAAVLAARARWRGIPTEIVTITADSTPPAGCDVYLLGGGEDTAQLFAADWLRRHRDLHHALDSSARVLAVCAGLQILGHTMRDRAGRDHPGLGVLDVTTTPGRRRAVGEITTACGIPGVGQLTGFENHLGVTALGTGTAPLGTVITGTGNGTRDHTGRPAEGVRTDRVIGTYLHGPVLARNPALADHLLTAITGTALAPLELPDQAALRRTYLSPRAARGVIHHRHRIPQEPHSRRKTFT